MNATTRCLTHVTMIAATLAAGLLAQEAHAAGPAPKVIHLETVHITGKRHVAEPVSVIQLPAVVIVGRRLVAEPVRVVQLPTVHITGKRDTELATGATLARTASL